MRPIQRLTAGKIGNDFITLDSADSLFADFAALGALALAAGRVAFAVAFAALGFAGAVFFGFAVTATLAFAAGFAAFAVPFFAAGAFAADFLLDVFFAPLAAIRFLPLRASLNCFARSIASDTMHLAMAKRPPYRAGRFLLAVLPALSLVAASAQARDVTFPIRLDDRFLTLELARSAFTDTDGQAHVFADDANCNSLVLFDPKVESETGALRVRSAGEAQFGVSAGGRCLLPLSWHGQIELVEEPHLERDAPVVRFVATDSRLLDDDGAEPLFSGTLWGWVKDYVHPRLEARIDLSEPVAQLREVLPAFGVGAPGSALDEALAQLTLDDVEVTDGVVLVRVRIPVPDPPATSATPEPAGTVAPLTPDELRRWQQALEQWDAFLTFIVKVTGGDTPVLALRRTLLSILLDERYALSEALASSDVRVHDPVRPLFLRAWTRLAPALREVAGGLPADQAVRYLSFVSAGDALAALDQLGPDSGIEISADGLRRLARLMVPSSSEDPLAYVPGVDPQLRELFGFGPPLPAPEENADVDAAAGAAAGDAEGATPAASATPTATVAPSASPDVAPTSWLWGWIGGTAWAAELPDPDVAKRLNAWAPTRVDIAEYAPLARRLLDSVTTWLLERHEIDPAHIAVFRALVPATAWKESCWRQYVKKSGKLVPLTSGAGAVGIMQVNVNVWRGFYDPGGLKRDVAYNARAGGEILSRYWTDYAVPRGEAAKGGGIDALARATYAAYNGGPSELTRYRDKRVKKRERVVDTDFFVKYQRMKAGDDLAVVDCYVD